MILVVEDVAADREHLTSVLAEAGMLSKPVGTRRRGDRALRGPRLRRDHAGSLGTAGPLTGLEVLQRLRDGKNGHVPVIVVTVIAERGAVAGFAVDDILAKPLAESALLASLSAAPSVAADGGRTVVACVVDDDPASLKVMAATLGRPPVTSPFASSIRCVGCVRHDRRAARGDRAGPPHAGHDRLRISRPAAHHRMPLHKVPVIVWTSKDLTADELVRLRASAHAVVSKGHDGNTRVVAELAAFLPPRREEHA